VDLRAGLDDLQKRKFFTPPGLEFRPLGRPIILNQITATDIFSRFPQSDQADAEIYHIRLEPLPSKSFPINFLLSSELLTASLNKLDMIKDICR
jgi:hypothetical protein